MTEAKISRGEAALRAEIARIGVNSSEENVWGAVSFASKLIDKRADTPPVWRRRLRRLAAHAVAARVARRHGDKAAVSEHFKKVTNHRAWLLRKGVSDDELKKLSLGIAYRMIGE